ncbi:TRAP transporter small permease [uncultured Ruegeria sp.]|uniref:TRAP transporter small permease n=1 Tax=uncultured Ruegeria sp. TaxID=259304 RepID=UPI00262F0343|nr:TRAP transporter small permease [uncultured Ruegeria sp.]
MRKMVKTVDDFAFMLEGVILFVVLCALVVILTMQVLFRFFLNQPLDFTEEIARLLFAWLVFVGAARAMRLSQHFLVDAVYNALPRTARSVVGYIVDLATLVFIMMLIWIGTQASIKGAAQIMPVLQVSKSMQTMALPVGMFLMAIHAVGFLFRRQHVGDPQGDAFVE